MKTAVEQLMIDSFGEDFRMTVNDYQLNAFQKALEKEKEQMIDFGYKCRNKCKKESKLLPQDIFNTTYNLKNNPKI